MHQEQGGGVEDSCERVEIDDLIAGGLHAPEAERILASLREPHPSISSKFFYDAKGSELFERITELPEYYLTRLEIPLIREAARSLSKRLDLAEIVEIGSGDCSKISALLGEFTRDQIGRLSYRPMDISGSALRESAARLVEEFPGLRIEALIADFMKQIDHFGESRGRRLFCFFGSTLGNLLPGQQEDFFEELSGAMSPGDRLLLGVDMVKDRAVVEKAYNDDSGVTSEFNLNILDVVNRIAGTDFDPAGFRHLAFYDEAHERIEMHLEAIEAQTVSSPHLGESILIRRGERIRTEYSHKFTQRAVRRLFERAGIEVEERFTDGEGWFSLYCGLRGGEPR